ncbi:MAG: PRC-barrel domain-containing protein [Acidimicrobiia bacterium]|nr:PRC-barrel domain-containing protein [Acidimicrobiia bacterium]
MSTLVRATTLVGNPVVTLAGESPLEVKDVVFSPNSGRLVGFTLRRHGFFGGPVDECLAWDDVHGLGPDAVVVTDDDALRSEHLDVAGEVTDDRVLTDDGTELGRVVDVIVATGRPAEVVGFEIKPTATHRRGDHHVFVPLPATSAVSDEAIVVPASAVDYLHDDLTGFGGAVDEFRRHLTEEDQ